MTHRTDTDRALLHADPLPYADGADLHDTDLALDADGRAREHTGLDHTEPTMPDDFLSLGDVPVHVTLTARYCQRLAGLLAEDEAFGRDVPGDRYVIQSLVNNAEAAMRAHRHAGVKPEAEVRPIRRVSEMGTVLPLRPDAA